MSFLTQTQFPRCCTQNMELFTTTSPQTVSRQQFQSGLKTHLFKCAYIWFYLRELLRSELTYLLTYTIPPGFWVVLSVQFLQPPMLYNVWPSHYHLFHSICPNHLNLFLIITLTGS